jgi:HIT domain
MHVLVDVQDGANAGQTVPHIHVHVLPRKLGDFEPNDKVYDAIDAAAKELPRCACGGKGCCYFFRNFFYFTFDAAAQELLRCWGGGGGSGQQR